MIVFHSRAMHNVHMFSLSLRSILRSTYKGQQLHDERGRGMAFPTRQDYVGQLQKHGLIINEADFVNDDGLTEAVYLDWLRRPQVGCIFAQLLARPSYRANLRTVVARGTSGIGDPTELATQIANLVSESVGNDSDESLSVLLPQVLIPETLVHLVWALGNQTMWKIEKETLWRRTLVLVGLRVEIAEGVFAETLGMGPYDIFPTTRQCPITTLEIRTKDIRAKRNRLTRNLLASHLADIPTEHIMKSSTHGLLRSKLTPWLKRRILGHQNDMRAKAGVTYSLPVAIWSTLKARGS